MKTSRGFESKTDVSGSTSSPPPTPRRTPVPHETRFPKQDGRFSVSSRSDRVNKVRGAILSGARRERRAPESVVGRIAQRIAKNDLRPRSQDAVVDLEHLEAIPGGKAPCGGIVQQHTLGYAAAVKSHGMKRRRFSSGPRSRHIAGTANRGTRKVGARIREPALSAAVPHRKPGRIVTETPRPPLNSVRTPEPRNENRTGLS